MLQESEEISPGPINVQLPDEEKLEITAKRPAIGSFRCRISPRFSLFYIGHSSVPATPGISGVLGLEMCEACLHS
jgi:hypothetical protein